MLEPLKLNAAESAAFVESLLNPPACNAALQEAAAHYKQVMEYDCEEDIRAEDKRIEALPSYQAELESSLDSVINDEGEVISPEEIRPWLEFLAAHALEEVDNNSVYDEDELSPAQVQAGLPGKVRTRAELEDLINQLNL